MSYDFNGTSDLLEASSVLTGRPATFAGWACPDIDAANGMIVSSDSDAIGTLFWVIAAGGGVAPLAAYRGTTGALNIADGTTVLPNDGVSWSHIGGTFKVGASGVIEIFVNGISEDTDTPSADATDATPIHTNIGSLDRSIGRTSYFAGKLAECAVWDVILSDEEMLALGLGASPLLVRPASLQMYVPLVGVPMDLTGNAGSWTVTTPVDAASHPRILRPQSPRFHALDSEAADFPLVAHIGA